MERTNTKCSGLSTIRVQTIRQTFNNINMVHLADEIYEIYISFSQYLIASRISTVYSEMVQCYFSLGIINSLCQIE